MEEEKTGSRRTGVQAELAAWISEGAKPVKGCAKALRERWSEGTAAIDSRLVPTSYSARKVPETTLKRTSTWQ